MIDADAGVAAARSPGTRSACPDYLNPDHAAGGLRSRALRGASLTVAGQITSFFIQTAGTLLLARLLTPRDFGLVALVLTVSLLLQNLGCNGFVEAVVQRERIAHAQLSTFFWINAALALLLTLCFLALIPALSWFYNEPALEPVAAVMALSILAGGLSNQHVSLLMRNMQFSRIAANELASSVLSIGAAILLAFWGWGYWALVAKWVLFPSLTTAGAWVLCSWRPGAPVRGSGVRPLLGFAFHTYGNFVMTFFRRNVDKMLVGRFLGVEPLGFYDRAYQLSNMLPGQILGPLNGVSITTFSRLAADKEKYRRNFLEVLGILAFVGMPLSAVLTLTARDVILFLLGPNWESSAVIFSAFGPAVGIAILYVTHGWLHLSLGTPDRWFRWSIVEFAVTVLCFAVGLRYGGLGVAAGFSISFCLLIGPALAYAGRPVDLEIRSVVAVVWRYVAAAASAGLACRFVLFELASPAALFGALPLWARLAVAGCLYMLVYLAFVVVLHGGAKPIVRFWSTAMEMLGRKKADQVQDQV